jgi:hypothetical protein
VIESLAAVSLDEVRGAAALLARVEQKYVVPVDSLPALVERLALPVLEIDGRRQFRYSSVYFDTPGWDTYLDAEHRRPKRHKVRTRTYVHTGACLLEVKSKVGQARKTKERTDHDPTRPTDLTATDLAFLGDRVPTLVARGLGATVTTSYERWTLVDLSLGARVTVDTGMGFADADGRRVTMPGWAIVETKSATGSGPADRLLWAAGHRPESLSKYAFGVATLHPELPHNTWHRALRRYVRAPEAVA